MLRELPKPLRKEEPPKYILTYKSSCNKQLVHLPSLEEFVALWKSTRKDDREQFVQERIEHTKSIRKVLQRLDVSFRDDR